MIEPVQYRVHFESAGTRLKRNNYAAQPLDEGLCQSQPPTSSEDYNA